MISAWPAVAQPGILATNEVHIWLVHLDRIPSVLPGWHSILSLEEQERAGRFHQRVHAERYAAARSSLRCILARYLEITPKQIEFTYEPFGKPRLSPHSHPGAPGFSISHSEDLGLIAVAARHEIGVDVERVRADLPVTDLARLYFAPQEAEIIHSISGPSQLEAFFRCWTRKEAYVKARGLGLSYGVNRIEVSVEAGAPAAIIRAADEPEAGQRWTLHHLSPAPGYIGAAAVPNRPSTVRCFTWSPLASP